MQTVRLCQDFLYPLGTEHMAIMAGSIATGQPSAPSPTKGREPHCSKP